MTLKEKFQNIYSDFLPLSNNQKNECVLIADEFAIEFAEWYLDLWNRNDKSFDNNSPKQLLEIFKKQKQL